MSYNPELIKKFEEEAKRRKEEEKKKEDAEKKAKQDASEKKERKKRHEQWRKKGLVYFKKMLKAEADAEAFKKYNEEQEALKQAEIAKQKALAREAQKAEWARVRQEAAREKAERRRKTRWYESGSYYFGDFLEDTSFGPNGINIHDKGDCHKTPHGHGEFWRPENKLEYKGQWLRGKMHGWGEYRFADGRVYIGEFRQGKMHGYGTISTSEGGTQRGAVFWKDKRMAWWDELCEGQTIDIKLSNLGYETGTWYTATIAEYDRNKKKLNNGGKRGKEHLIEWEFGIPPPGYKDSIWMNLSRVQFRSHGPSSTVGNEEPLKHPIVNTRLVTGRCIPQKRTCDILENNVEFKRLLRKGFHCEIAEDEARQQGKKNTPKKAGLSVVRLADHGEKEKENTPKEKRKNLKKSSGQLAVLKVYPNPETTVRSTPWGNSEYESKYEESNLDYSFYALADNEPEYAHKTDHLKTVLMLRERVGKQLSLR